VSVDSSIEANTTVQHGATCDERAHSVHIEMNRRGAKSAAKA